MSEKLANLGTQKPSCILHLIKAAKHCLSLAEVNSHQALAAPENYTKSNNSWQQIVQNRISSPR